MKPSARVPVLVVALAIGAVGAVAVPADAAARPKCFGRTATIVGTNGDDVLKGTAGADVIVGRGGQDTILARGGTTASAPDAG
jgi:hypothetical protein